MGLTVLHYITIIVLHSSFDTFLNPQKITKLKITTLKKYVDCIKLDSNAKIERFGVVHKKCLRF